MLMLKNRPRKLKKLVIDRVDLVPQGANPDAHIVLYKSQEGAPVAKQGGEPPALTLEQRQQARQLWQLWGDFCDTVYALMERCASDASAAPALLASIEQFHAQAETALSTLGLLTKAMPSLALLKAVPQVMAKAGAIMSADRRARLQAAIDALQALLEEAMPTEASTTEKGHRMTAYEEIVTLATAMVEKGLAPTKHQAVAKLAHDRPDLRRRYYDEPKPHLVAKREELPARHWSLVKLEAMAQELVAKGKAPTKHQAMAEVVKTAEGRELAAAYRQRTRG